METTGLGVECCLTGSCIHLGNKFLGSRALFGSRVPFGNGTLFGSCVPFGGGVLFGGHLSPSPMFGHGSSLSTNRGNVDPHEVA